MGDIWCEKESIESDLIFDYLVLHKLCTNRQLKEHYVYVFL